LRRILANGKAGAGINVLLEFLAKGVTDFAGQINALLSTDSSLATGFYRVSFDTKSYMESIGKHVLLSVCSDCFRSE
jgi:5-hydroxyisourate hydrolase-like protein (transthyretin family)